jgi:RimJ/RimL family protein N-acetyltransferase
MSPGAYVLETSRLALRGWSLDDTSEALAIYGDPRVHRFLPQGAYERDTPDRVRAMLERSIATIASLGFGHWAVVERDGGALVGNCGFRPPVAECNELEIGFTLAPSRWGRGYAVEIVAATLRHGFERRGASRIVAMTSPANAPAQRVLERVGMRTTGEVTDEGFVWKAYAIEPRDLTPAA